MSTDPIVMLNATNAAAGGKVDAGTVVAVAKSSQSVDEATTNIQAIAHAGNIVKLYDTMKQASPSQQAQGWEGLSSTEQESSQVDRLQPSEPRTRSPTQGQAGSTAGSGLTYSAESNPPPSDGPSTLHGYRDKSRAHHATRTFPVLE